MTAASTDNPPVCSSCGRNAPLLGTPFCSACLLAYGSASPRAEQSDWSLHYLAPGTQIGRYTIVELLGEGGFAEVYSATAEQPDRNGSAPERIALKVVKRGMDSREIVSRFRAEHRTLQSLAHSSIVQVFETGLTDAGLPYFVMAQVDGVPVTDYCEAAKLSIRARLQLFLKFCEAVQHAHQKGILHRDLKPSNILVEETPEGPMPKVIDFGVARALEPVGSGETLVTQLGQVLGTPTYMSPEQAAGDDAADTRGDIYSLGAVLYEMLSGCPPFDVATLSRLSPMQWARHLRETTPPLPSTKLRQQGGTADCVARLRGDLDDVVRKAIAPDPDQRYASAAALAEDVQHWLDDRPVAAHPPSIHYVVRKFVERHRWPVAVAVSILAGIVATAGIGTVLAIRARASEANALIEKDRALAAEAEARQARERSDHRTYQARIQVAKLHLDQGEPHLAAERLRQTRTRLRGWEWGFLMAAIAPPEAAAQSGLANASLINATPDGAIAIVAEGRQVHVVHVTRDEVLAKREFAGRVVRISISDDGTRLAVIESGATGDVLHVARLDGSDSWTEPLCAGADVAWEPQVVGGALLAVCGNGPTPVAGRLVRFAGATGEVLNERSIERFKVLAQGLTVGRSGRMAVVGTSYKDLEIVALPTLEKLSVDQQESGEAVQAVLLDDARDLLAVARGNHIYAGRASGAPTTLAGESIQARHLNWLPNGSWIAAGEGALLVEGQPVQRCAAAGALDAVSLTGGRALVLLASGRLEIRPELPSSPAHPVTVSGGDDAEGRGTGFTSDSRHALFEPWRRNGVEFVSLAEAAEGRVGSTWTRFPAQPAAEWSALPAIGAGGAVLTNVSGRLGVLRADGETIQQMPIPDIGPAWSASASRDGSRLAVGIASGVRLLEWPSGTLVREWALPNGPFHVFLLERAVAAIDRDATLHYLPVDGAPVAHRLPFRVNGYYPAPLAFFPERALLAGATTEPGFAVYDLAALPAAPRLVTRTSFVPNVTALAFSPAAARLAIATDDHRLAIWDWEHELPLLTFPLNSTCASVAFSPDGQWLANTDYAPSLVLRRAALSAASK